MMRVGQELYILAINFTAAHGINSRTEADFHNLYLNSANISVLAFYFIKSIEKSLQTHPV